MDVVNLIDRNPTLLTSGLSSLSGLYQAYQSQKKSGSCCGSNQSFINTYRNAFEGALAGLSGDDQRKAKGVLKVDQICYYYRDGKNNLQMTCF